MESNSELQTSENPDSERVKNGSALRLFGLRLIALVPNFVLVLFNRAFAKVDIAGKRLKLEFSQLTFSQICYFVAIVLFFTIVDGELSESPNTKWVALVAGIGLMRELWSLFHRIWQKTLGKGVLLVLYAATANFALAVSALKINNIAGIEPTPFIFTLGFTTLTMLPFWLIMASVLFFAIALVVQTTWLVVGLLLRIIRIKIRMHWEDEGFAVLTIIFRLILTPIVITALTQTARPYMEQVNFLDAPGFFNIEDDRIQVRDPETNRPVVQLFGEPGDFVQEIKEQVKAEEARQQAEADNTHNEPLSTEDTDELMEEVETHRDLDQFIAALPYFKALSAINVPLNFSVSEKDPVTEIINDSYANTIDGESSLVQGDGEPTSGNNDPDAASSSQVEQSQESRDLDKLIAAFIFHFETYPNSMCKKKSTQHSLVIDENSVLLVEKSDTELGYTFTVEECVHVYRKD